MATKKLTIPIMLILIAGTIALFSSNSGQNLINQIPDAVSKEGTSFTLFLDVDKNSFKQATSESEPFSCRPSGYLAFNQPFSLFSTQVGFKVTHAGVDLVRKTIEVSTLGADEKLTIDGCAPEGANAVRVDYVDSDGFLIDSKVVNI